MDVTRFAIRNNRLTLVALLAILLAGAASYRRLPRAEDPGFTIRTAVVRTVFPGANPERVENLVTDKIEKIIQEMPELDVVRSQSQTGLSIIFVDIHEQYREMRPIWDSLRRKVEKATPDLPGGVIGPFVNDEFGDVFGIILAITAGLTRDASPQIEYRELKHIAYSVRDLLLRLEDAGKVEVYGIQDERVFVEYNNARLAELGLSVVQLERILEARNIIMPGGSVTTGVERIELEPSGNFDSIEDLRRTVISVPGRSDLLYLQDIAQITRGYIDPPDSRMHASGLPSVGLAISTKGGGNLISLGEDVRLLVQRLNAEYPTGIDFNLVAFQPDIVTRKIDEFVSNVMQAIGIVLVVMLIMLGLRTGLVVASLIPSAILMSLLIMSLIGVGLNQMSLAALIIALGMLVDNAIVMSESIMVQMAAGTPALAAAVGSARELRIPLLTSSLTTSAAFLPIFLAESAVGEYTNLLFTVVTITLISSWCLTLTVIPLLCVLFLKVKSVDREETYRSRFYSFYRGILLSALRFPLFTLLVVVAVFVFSLQGFNYIPNIFFPPSDTPMFWAEIESPVGTAIERNEEIVAEIENFVEQELVAGPERPEGIISWMAYIGNGGPRFTLTYAPEQSSPEYSFLPFNATSRGVIRELSNSIDAFCRERFPNVVATIKPIPIGPIIDKPIEVRVSGENLTELFRIVEEVKAKIREIPGTRNTGDDWGQRTKKIVVKINNARARRSGITNRDIAISLQSVLSGYQATDYREGDEVIPVTMRSVAADRKDFGKLESLNVYSQSTGYSVPLKQVADLEVEWQPARIFRRDRLKSVKIHSDLALGVTPVEITNGLEPWLAEQQSGWPVGYFYSLGGEYEQSGKANRSIGEKAPIALILIVLLLVAQFNSIRKPLIILATIPLGLIGVIAGLIIGQSYFGFMTLLGIISLSGIVINNAIVLLDRIQIEITENELDPARAVIEASQRRLRPILLTTITTMGGLLPLWLGGGPMWEPMAIAIIFGLMFSTLLTLGVVPVLYSLFFRVRFKGFRY